MKNNSLRNNYTSNLFHYIINKQNGKNKFEFKWRTSRLIYSEKLFMSK